MRIIEYQLKVEGENEARYNARKQTAMFHISKLQQIEKVVKVEQDQEKIRIHIENPKDTWEIIKG